MSELDKATHELDPASEEPNLASVLYLAEKVGQAHGDKKLPLRDLQRLISRGKVDWDATPLSAGTSIDEATSGANITVPGSGFSTLSHVAGSSEPAGFTATEFNLAEGSEIIVKKPDLTGSNVSAMVIGMMPASVTLAQAFDSFTNNTDIPGMGVVYYLGHNGNTLVLDGGVSSYVAGPALGGVPNGSDIAISMDATGTVSITAPGISFTSPSPTSDTTPQMKVIFASITDTPIPASQPDILFSLGASAEEAALPSVPAGTWLNVTHPGTINGAAVKPGDTVITGPTNTVIKAAENIDYETVEGVISKISALEASISAELAKPFSPAAAIKSTTTLSQTMYRTFKNRLVVLYNPNAFNEPDLEVEMEFESNSFDGLDDGDVIYLFNYSSTTFNNGSGGASYPVTINFPKESSYFRCPEGFRAVLPPGGFATLRVVKDSDATPPGAASNTHYWYHMLYEGPMVSDAGAAVNELPNKTQTTYYGLAPVSDFGGGISAPFSGSVKAGSLTFTDGEIERNGTYPAKNLMVKVESNGALQAYVYDPVTFTLTSEGSASSQLVKSVRAIDSEYYAVVLDTDELALMRFASGVWSLRSTCGLIVDQGETICGFVPVEYQAGNHVDIAVSSSLSGRSDSGGGLVRVRFEFGPVSWSLQGNLSIDYFGGQYNPAEVDMILLPGNRLAMAVKGSRNDQFYIAGWDVNSKRYVELGKGPDTVASNGASNNHSIYMLPDGQIAITAFGGASGHAGSVVTREKTESRFPGSPKYDWEVSTPPTWASSADVPVCGAIDPLGRIVGYSHVGTGAVGELKVYEFKETTGNLHNLAAVIPSAAPVDWNV